MIQARVPEHPQVAFVDRGRVEQDVEAQADPPGVLAAELLDPGPGEDEAVVVEADPLEARADRARQLDLLQDVLDAALAVVRAQVGVDLAVLAVVAKRALEGAAAGGVDPVHRVVDGRVPRHHLAVLEHQHLRPQQLVAEGQGVQVLDQGPRRVAEHLVAVPDPEVRDAVDGLTVADRGGQVQQGQLALADAHGVRVVDAVLRRDGRVDAPPDHVGVGDLPGQAGQLGDDAQVGGPESDPDHVGGLLPDHLLEQAQLLVGRGLDVVVAPRLHVEDRRLEPIATEHGGEHADALVLVAVGRDQQDACHGRTGIS